MKPRHLLVVGALVVAIVAPGAADASLNQWHPLNGDVGATPMAMVSLPGHPDSLYLASYLEDFRRSDDGGVTWAVRAVAPCQVKTMGVDPANPSNIYMGCWHEGMVKSTDGGQTWTADNSGLTYPEYPTETPGVDAIVVDPNDPDTIYIATYQDQLGDDVFVSHDAGDSWTPIHAGPEMDGLALSGGRIYVGNGGSVLTSDDGGTMWNTTTGIDASKSLLAEPGSPATVFAFAWPSDNTGAAWMTTDGGDTWAQLANAPADIISASAIPGHVFVGTLTGVWETSDNGDTWTQSDAVLGGNLQGFAVAADPAKPGHVWVAGDRGGLWEVTFDDSLIPGSFPYYQAGTLPATNVTPTSAVLHGIAAAADQGVTGSYFFSWGTTSSYDNGTAQTPLPTEIQSGADTEVSTTLTGLQPDTTYHFQLRAFAGWWGTSGISRPDDITFTTPPAAPPTVDGPSVDLRQTTAPGSGLPVAFHWGISRGTYPLCGTALQISVDGSTFKPLARTGARVRRYPTDLQSGHRYTVRAQARDCTGLRGDWSATQFDLRRRAHAPEVAYGRHWTLSGGIHTTTSRGARVGLTFAGGKVGIVALTGRHLGKAAIFVDGERAGTVRFTADHAPRLQTIHLTSVDSGRHTIVLRALDSRAVSVQSFAVIHS